MQIRERIAVRVLSCWGDSYGILELEFIMQTYKDNICLDKRCVNVISESYCQMFLQMFVLILQSMAVPLLNT